uniref:Uncharacterized protein n=1 Tax=Arundo donax TaxID=35708 RepID=A0A0A8YCW4_ARUDO
MDRNVALEPPPPGSCPRAPSRSWPTGCGGGCCSCCCQG